MNQFVQSRSNTSIIRLILRFGIEIVWDISFCFTVKVPLWLLGRPRGVVTVCICVCANFETPGPRTYAL